MADKSAVGEPEAPRPAVPRARGTAKVAIVGAGHVATTLAYTCLVRGVGKTIALYDRDPDRVPAEVLDLNHGLQFVPMAALVGSADIEICRGADVVVVTAGANDAPGQTRLDVAEANVAICRELVPRLVEVAPCAILLFVTNPAARVDIFRRVVRGGYEILAGKGFANYAVSLATARIIESVLYDEHQVLPVSSLIDDFIGIGDVCLSVPSVVNRNGVQHTLPVQLSSSEAQALRRSATAVRTVIQRCGL